MHQGRAARNARQHVPSCPEKKKRDGKLDRREVLEHKWSLQRNGLKVEVLGDSNSVVRMKTEGPNPTESDQLRGKVLPEDRQRPVSGRPPRRNANPGSIR